jgi:hypothetical protein
VAGGRAPAGTRWRDWLKSKVLTLCPRNLRQKLDWIANREAGDA